MNILFDHQIFSKQIYGGASKYFCEVMKRLPVSSWKTSTLFSNNEYLKQLSLFYYLNILPDRYLKGKATLMDYMNRPITFFKLMRRNYDIFHQTDYATYYFAAIKGKKMVTTFHDMNYTLFYDQYSDKLTKRLDKLISLQKKSVERADIIISVSHNTKKDLVNLWNVKPEKIVVIHHGVDKNRRIDINPSRILEEHYILYVGERSVFKNFERFIQAFASISAQHPELKLVCTGRALSEIERDQMANLGIQNKVLSMSADERTMARLYRDAEMFVYPTYSEGFGMPILEAMVYDCPVVVSDASCLPEVVGEAGLYFNPYQVEDMIQKIQTLLTSPTLRMELIAKGKKQLEKFSWEKSASEHLAVYRSLLN